MKGDQGIGSSIVTWLRQRVALWWGSVGCRVSFYMSFALVLAAILSGAFLIVERASLLRSEIRERALYLSRNTASLTLEDIVAGRRAALHRTLNAAFASFSGQAIDQELQYLFIYDRTGGLVAGRTRSEMVTPEGRHLLSDSPEESLPLPATFLGDSERAVREPVFRRINEGHYELILPVMVSDRSAGFIRAGLSDRGQADRLFTMVQKGMLILAIVVLLGMAFSRLIATSITRPITELSAAADELKRQNWSTPVAVRGGGEIRRLVETFNDMAQTLKQREMSLSRGNRDLFILHTAGLDLMEVLDSEELPRRVAARAEDLVRADTIALSRLDPQQRELSYIGLYGGRAKEIEELGQAIEAGGVFNWIASYGTPLLVADAQADFRLDSGRMASLGIRSIMSVPLWTANVMTGLLTAVNKKGGGSFDKHDLRLFTVFSNLVCSAMQNADLYRDLKRNMLQLEQAQGQFVRAEKMAAIGELAANVAHEVNNPLTSVLGYTSHLNKTLDLPDSQKRMLQMIEQETLRVRKIIRSLLDFSSQRPSWMHPADILLPLRESVALLQGVAASSSVRVIEEYDSSPLTATINANEMKQVFINITTNAIQAMPQGGELRIRADYRDPGEVLVEFADTGVGIADDHKMRIFEPFFSTKAEGRGTGLGLSISYRIVQNHGGRIEVESRPGAGSTFRVILPQASPKVVAPKI